MPEREVVSTNTVIVGAGPAGLAVGARLRTAGVPFVILEQTGLVGSAWHRHYDRLHLHTPKQISALPGLPFPKEYPTYPSRDQFAAYLAAYERHFQLGPRFGQEVMRVQFREGTWETETADTVYRSDNLVIATGYTRVPHLPEWPGQDHYRGRVLHSSDYKNGEPFRGKRVLVVGFGNSGGEIAIDLWEHGAQPSMAVRSPVNIIPRDILGVPFLFVNLLLSRLPTRLVDVLAAPIQALTLGGLADLGLRRPSYGPSTQVSKTGRIPLIDIGTVRLIRKGEVRVHPGIEQFTSDGVRFVDGMSKPFDAVILATGYRPAVNQFLPDAAGAVSHEGAPVCSGAETKLPGLYFCGFHVSRNGMLREIAAESRQIARVIAR